MCNPCRSTCLWFVFLPVVAPTQMRSSTSHALLTGCGVRGTARQSLPRLLVSCLGVCGDSRWNHRDFDRNVSTCHTLCTLASCCGRCRRIDGESDGLRSSARLPPEGYRIRRMFHVFDVDSRPVLSGTSCSVSNQPLETMLCSRCAAEASLGRICRFCKPMPTRPSCTKDSGIF